LTVILKKSLSRFEDFLALPKPEVSFEFFPTKNKEMEEILWKTIKTLEPLGPKFVSVTYGAGGSTRDATLNTVERISKETSLKPAAHLTCIGASKEEINNIATNYWKAGIKHIVALRGDPPAGEGKYTPYPGGYPYCVELVRGLKEIADFEISVASFPEVHPEATSPEADLDYLKQKIEAGADRAITQYFFDTDVYLSFRERAATAGIKAPIVPGIMLITSFDGIVKFSKRCGATIPKWAYDLLSGLDKEPDRLNIVSAMIAAEQCRILREEGVEHFHFYTMNRPTLALAVCHILGIRA